MFVFYWWGVFGVGDVVVGGYLVDVVGMDYLV